MEPAAFKLPTYAALKATYGEAPYKYLGVEDDGKVAYTTDKVVSLRAKFVLEFAGVGLVHIRSSHNNKYWVRSSESEYWIVAAAESPVEDKTAWNCTLFSYDTNADGNNVTFVHEQLGKPVGRRDVAPDREMYLCLEPTATTTDISTVVDYDSLVILPQYVAFKDENGQYLHTQMTELPCIFGNDDVGTDGNAFEVFTTRDGHIYLKGYNTAGSSNGRYWGMLDSSGQSVYAKGTIYCNVLYNPVEDEVDNGPADDSGVMVFSVVKSGASIALLHLKSNKYLERRSLYDDAEENAPWGLRESSNTVTNKAKLTVVEPLLGRQVDVFEFHLDRARIYDRVPLTYAEGGASNPTNSEQEYTLTFSYSKNTSSTWTTTESWHIDTTVSLTSKIPFIGESSIEIGSGYSHDYEWGTTVENSEEVTSSYTVKVPAMTKAKVFGIATQATCDVPYSYEKVDQLPNGQLQRTTWSDGVYTGINAYNFDYDVAYEPINQVI